MTSRSPSQPKQFCDSVKLLRKWVHQGNILTKQPTIFKSVSVVG